MRRHDGIVIVAALVIMMLVMGMASGMLFLTRTDLKTAENARSKAEAKFAAESGTDAALIAVDEYYKANEEYPSLEDGTLVAPVIQVNSDSYDLDINTTSLSYSIDGFEIDADNPSYAKLVVGTATDDAVHQSEVLLFGDNSSSIVDPLAGNGLESEGIVSLNGTSNFVSAGLHGNAGYSISSLGSTNFYVCTARNPTTGKCTATTAVDSSNLPITAASGQSSYTCAPANSSICVNGIPFRLEDPITITPDYANRRANMITAAAKTTGTTSSVFGIKCDSVINAPYAPGTVATGSWTGKTICIHGTGRLTLPSGVNLSNVKLLAQGEVYFNAGSSAASKIATLSNSLIVGNTFTYKSSISKFIVGNSAIYIDNNLTIPGNATTYSGITTIASGGSITVNGSSTVVSEDGLLGIGIGLIAEGDVKINGSSDWFANSLVGGTFTYDGGTTLHGGVSAKGSITVNGGIDIDSGLDIFNDDLLDLDFLVKVSETSRR